jgi:hypothetical protein
VEHAELVAQRQLLGGNGGAAAKQRAQEEDDRAHEAPAAPRFGIFEAAS